MQEHQESQGEAAAPAALVRVKTEELAHALAAIEARRQDEARRLAGTIALGDAVQDLQLDVTPEEILAEVQAQRERRQEETQEEQTRLADSFPFFWTVTKILGAIVGAFMILAWLMSLGSRPSTMPTGVRQTGVPTNPRISDVPVTPRGFVKLLDVADGQPFSCPYYIASPLIRGSLPPTAVVPIYPSQMRNMGLENWTFIKHGGKIYVRGWVAAEDIGNISRASQIHIFSLPNTPELRKNGKQVTLPVAHLTSQGMYLRTGKRVLENYDREDSVMKPWQDEQILASHVVPDEHLLEKWQ